MNSPVLSTYSIEQRLLELAALRSDLEVEGNSEALQAVDAELARYLTEQAVRDPRAHRGQVNSLALLIKREMKDADELEAEAKELTLRAKRRRAFAEQLKANVLANMERFGVIRIETPEATLRVQRNGGVQPLEVDMSELPEEYTIETWEFRNLTQDEKIHLMDTVIKLCGEKTKCLPERPNNEAIREALTQHLICPECQGKRVAEPVECAPDEDQIGNYTACPRCNGAGSIPNTVPGAKLLPLGRHLRVG